MSRNTWRWRPTDANEFDNGFVEVHDAPTDRHQAIISYFIAVFRSLAKQIGGVERPAGLRLRLWDQKYREPDIVFLRDRGSSLRNENYWDGTDLAIEIVSASLEDRERDLVAKRIEYAQAGIQEYWIVDPAEVTITVLSLSGDVYSESGFLQSRRCRLHLPFCLNLPCLSRKSWTRTDRTLISSRCRRDRC